MMEPVTTFVNGVNPFISPTKKVPGEGTRNAVLRVLKRWGTVTARVVSEETELPTSIVSCCLSRLAQDGVLSTIKNNKNQGYIYSICEEAQTC